MEFSDSWSVPIEKLMIWRNNNWTKYETKCDNTILHVLCDQVLIRSASKILESLNTNNKIKGIYKQDVLILFVSFTGKEIRKIKFRIKINAAQCYQKLGEYFPLMSYEAKTCTPSKYKNFGEVLESILTQLSDDHDCSRLPMPVKYHNFIKLCIMDPGFSKIVKETDVMVKEMLKNKK